MWHLFHPALVHFSVAFLVVGGLSEAWGWVKDEPAARQFGSTLLLIGLVSLIPTVFTGYIAANSLEVPDASRPLLDAHERNGWFVAAVFVLAIFWKAWFRGEIPPAQRWLYALWLVFCVLLTAYSAMLGGEMVYLHGIGVEPR